MADHDRSWILHILGWCLLPWVSAMEMTIVRPEPGQFLSVPFGYTFVMGTVAPVGAQVECNGVRCDVDEDGAFIGFVPIRKLHNWVIENEKICDVVFEFEIRVGDETVRRLVHGYTPRSPSAAILAHHVFDPPVPIKVLKDQWINLDGDAIDQYVFIPEGSVVPANFGNTNNFRLKLSEFTEVAIPSEEAKPVESLEGGIFKPWELRIADQRQIQCLAPTSLLWKTNQLLWGFQWATNNGTPELKIRTAIRGDGLPLDPLNPFKGLRICLDPGHHPDKGAVGPRGLEERESNLKISRVLAELLRDKGAIVVLTREEEALPLRERHHRMRQIQPDLVVSIHNNSVGEGRDPRLKHGTQTFYLYPWSKAFAEAVHRAMLEGLGTVDMGCIKRNLYVPRFTDCPSILVEPEYLILPAQEKRFLDPIYRERLARSIVKGILDFLREVPEKS